MARRKTSMTAGAYCQSDDVAIHGSRHESGRSISHRPGSKDGAHSAAEGCADRLSIGLTLPLRFGIRRRFRRRFRRRLAFRDANAASLHPGIEIFGAHPATVLAHVEPIGLCDRRRFGRWHRGVFGGRGARRASGEHEHAAADDREIGSHNGRSARSCGWIPRAECRRGHRAGVGTGRDTAHKTNDPMPPVSCG